MREKRESPTANVDPEIAAWLNELIAKKIVKTWTDAGGEVWYQVCDKKRFDAYRTSEVENYLQWFYDQGYAIAVVSHEDLHGIRPSDIETVMIVAAKKALKELEHEEEE